ncbi:fimbrial protein [Lelliottia wanjuensis]|uniref:fimbrial protein n=1 Tax=Lelliottia wanjuensis TaxID=3050585 RepID=UPI00254F92C3|nr:fimbrial protein [Lelliottia sp. V86_10]MDK9586398.1 fimbrial protein [Lelliottia sp. V86_10]
MKKIISVFAGLFFISPMLGCPAYADLAQINLTMTGTIVDSTCDIDTNSKNQTVHIGSFATTDFKSVGSVSVDAPFTIVLKKCSSMIKNAGILFTGTTGSDPTLLSLTDTSGGGNIASGVAVQVLDKDKKPVAINSSSPLNYALKSGDNTLNFSLRYKSTLATVTPGNATAVLYFSVEYP